MQFLNPAVLGGLVAAALPLAIHLLHRGRAQAHPFSDLAFLHQLHHNRMRRVQLRQWLVLLLRMLFIALVVCAFARPTYRDGGGWSGTRPVAAHLLIDLSYSTRYRLPSGTIFAQLQNQLRDLLAVFTARDRISLQPFAQRPEPPLEGNLDFLAERPVGILWGVGKSLAGKLRRHGITKIGQLQHIEERELMARYGAIGQRLYQFSRGEDTRRVEPNSPTKSISAETTFASDIGDLDTLVDRITPLCDTVARRLQNKGLAGRGVTVKLKQSDFRQLTRARKLADPTQQADIIFEAAKALLAAEADGRTFRLIGVGVGDLTDAAEADPPDLFALADRHGDE